MLPTQTFTMDKDQVVDGVFKAGSVLGILSFARTFLFTKKSEEKQPLLVRQTPKKFQQKFKTDDDFLTAVGAFTEDEFVTKSHLDENFVSDTDLGTNLDRYVTQSTLARYVTQSTLDSQKYLSEFDLAKKNFVTTSALKQGKDDMQKQFDSVTGNLKSQIGTTKNLADRIAGLEAAMAQLVTKDELQQYMTNAEIESRYVPFEQLTNRKLKSKSSRKNGDNGYGILTGFSSHQEIAFDDETILGQYMSKDEMKEYLTKAEVQDLLSAFVTYEDLKNRIPQAATAKKTSKKTK